MTYRQLQKVLNTFNENNLNNQVIFFNDGVFHKNVALVISDETNKTLDTNHSYFELLEE